MNPVEQYIFKQEPELRELLLIIRSLILNCDRQVKETISYRIPFFKRNKPLCYLNPKKDGIDLVLQLINKLPYFYTSFSFMMR